MKEFWDNRYANEEYAYGIKPNNFFRQELLKLNPKTILFPAEGEGRNAVFAAKNGWIVKAFDFSVSGQNKALKLAAQQETIIDYEIAGFDDFKASPDSFDCIVLIHAHTPADKRHSYHKKMVEFLKPGGTLILEGFSKEQIHNASGGPKNTGMLFSKEELLEDFKELKEIKIETLETELEEGEFHQGTASVIRLLATK